MQKPIATFLFVWVLVLGCHHDDPEHPATTHLRNYLQLKKKSPDSALVELIQHAKIAFQEHPQAAEWAQLVARLDGAGRASLPDRLRLRRLELEMARENDVPAEYLESLEEDVLVLEEVEKELNAEGTDPHTFFVAFRLEISDD